MALLPLSMALSAVAFVIGAMEGPEQSRQDTR
jgi:hypothetical protein